MFFEPDSFSEHKLSMEHFREWAGEIATSYVNGGTAPTDSLLKIAGQEDLTPHQIAVLAAEANKEIHRIKFASAKNKYFAADFPLADARHAISKLQAGPGEVKFASAMPEPVFSDDFDPFAAFGVKEEVMDKTADVKHELKVAAIRGELLENKLEDEITLIKQAVEDSEHKFIKQAREYVLTAENSSDRMKCLGNLDKFIKEANMGFAKHLLAKVAYVVGREGYLEPAHAKTAVDYFTMSKEADITAPQVLISEWLPAQIVNGTHPLYITLKTIKNKHSALDLASNQHKLVEDRLHIIHQKVRAL
jgi:hypothetical protein